MERCDFLPLHRQPERSPTLPGFVYHDPDIYLQEQGKIFARTWQLVAHRSQLLERGDYICAEVAGESIFVVHGEEGQIRAFYNVCQHRAHRVLSGKGRVRARIVCPYHAWTYKLDGSLAAARGIDALPNFDKDCFGLKPVRLDEQLGFIFVNLDDDAPPIADVAGSMFADIKHCLPWIEGARLDEVATGTSWEGSDLQANWKVLSDNCRECYHCAPGHKAFVDMMDMKTYRFAIHDGWVKSEAALGKEDNKAYAVSRDEPQSEALFWHFWPNMEFGILPGERSFGAFRIFPIGPEETHMTSMILSGDGSTVIHERLDYRWNILWPEDESLCLSVHQGLKSRAYRQGRFVIDPVNLGISEQRVHDFQLRYAEAMGFPIADDKG